MLDLLDQVVKSAILNKFKEVKEAMSKELKENVRTVSHRIECINKKLEILERIQIEILELKSNSYGLENLLEGFSNGFELAEEGIRKFKDKSIDTI